MIGRWLSVVCAISALTILGGYAVAAVIVLWGTETLNPEVIGQIMPPVMVGFALGLMALCIAKWAFMPTSKGRKSQHVRLPPARRR
jgi:hypothetical protein